jgi:hypothetical protein
VGSAVGIKDGTAEGSEVAITVGTEEGTNVGSVEGTRDGRNVGMTEGTRVGKTVGIEVDEEPPAQVFGATAKPPTEVGFELGIQEVAVTPPQRVF